MTELHYSVLLLEGKIINWKAGRTLWDSVDTALKNKQFVKLIIGNEDRISVESKTVIITSNDEYSDFFENGDFFTKYKIHPTVADKIFLPF